MESVHRFDALLDSLTARDDPAFQLEKFRRREGLPIDVALGSGNAKLHPNRLEGDDLVGEGRIAVAFFRRLALVSGSDLRFDTVFEVARPDARRALRKWNVPFNWGAVAGVDGSELLVPYRFGPLCHDPGHGVDVLLPIRPDGRYRVTQPRDDDHSNTSPGPEHCDAARHLFGNSAYARCEVHLDRTTGRKRILVYQGPTT